MRITDLPTLGDSPLAEDSPALASAGITRGYPWMAETQGTPQRPGDPPVHAPILGAECRCDAAVRSAVGKHPSKHRRLTEAEREAAYRQRVERRQRLAHLASRHQRAAALRWTPLVETRLIRVDRRAA